MQGCMYRCMLHFQGLLCLGVFRSLSIDSLRLLDLVVLCFVGLLLSGLCFGFVELFVLVVFGCLLCLGLRIVGLLGLSGSSLFCLL